MDSASAQNSLAVVIRVAIAVPGQALAGRRAAGAEARRQSV
jgi:hypothetical protein